MTGPQPAPFRHDVSPSAAPALWKRAILRWNSRYRQLGRIVASNTLSPALAKFLHFIVMETLEGRADQLSEYVIAEKVFNQKEFAPSEKSVVRVEKRRLREKLKDYYEAAGKDDPVVISLGTNFVPIFSTRANGVPQRPVPRRRWTWAWPVSVMAIAVTIGLILWIVRKKPSDELLLSRLTYDAGFTTHPAISTDGSLVAYASDRNGEGNLDIWVQNIGTGDRVRLAPNPADDYGPSFSPDGSKVAFRSDRDGGGIYAVAVLGGDNDGTRTIYVTRFRDGSPGGRETWIPVTSGNEMDREVRWAPGGALLYFLSERDGFRCIWAQRLDRQTKQPAGAAFPVYHFHHSQQSLMSIGSPGKVGLSIANGALIFSLAETTGNIWMARGRR
jgi:hypothetical protein